LERGEKGLKISPFFQGKMSEKQSTFFTVNCAENFESPNQCFPRKYRQGCRLFSDLSLCRLSRGGGGNSGFSAAPTVKEEFSKQKSERHNNDFNSVL
jgi:hypothetical protein